MSCEDEKLVCEYCDHCLPIGEGDHICDKNEVPVMVLSEYAPNEDYLYCKRKRATNGATLIAQGGHVNFTKFSVHLHFSKRIGGLQAWINLTI